MTVNLGSFGRVVEEVAQEGPKFDIGEQTFECKPTSNALVMGAYAGAVLEVEKALEDGKLDDEILIIGAVQTFGGFIEECLIENNVYRDPTDEEIAAGNKEKVLVSNEKGRFAKAIVDHNVSVGELLELASTREKT
jgi:hypothetical protein